MSAPESAIPPVSMKLRDSAPLEFANALGESFKRYGFAVIADHELNQSIIDTALDRTKTFFAMSPEDKSKYKHTKEGQRGYFPFGQEKAKDAEHIDLKEFWHIGRDLPDDHQFKSYMPSNISIDEIPDWHTKTYAMFDAMDQLGLKVMSSIALYLDLKENWFDSAMNDGNSVLRLLHYPAQDTPPPEGSVRAAEHGDINVITLLLGAEEGGLEVKDRDGRWLPITPPEGCLVVNVGDMLERLTNNVLPSTLHRVVNPKPERCRFARYSTPFFAHFRPDFEIKTLENCISSDNPNQYPDTITANEYLLQRLREINLI